MKQQQQQQQRLAALAIIATIITAAFATAPRLAYALPSPINFQRSIPFNVFNSVSATVYTLDKPADSPFEVNLLNGLTYGDTGATRGAIVKIQDATSGSMNALEIVMYNTKSIDINWTDRVTGTTTKIGSLNGNTQQNIPKEIVVENLGSALNVKLADGTVIIDNFVLPANFKIVAVSAYGNGATGGVATAGFVTAYVGGINPTKMVGVSVNALIPMVTAVVVIGLVIGVFGKLTKKI